MWLGAVVGAGASLEAIEAAVATLGTGDVRMSYGRVRRGGREAVAVRVRAPQETPRVHGIAQVRSLLQFAAIDEPVRDRVLAVFERLAASVADTQGIAPEQVEFHEMAMLDDLAAIVGTCVGLHDLGVDVLLCGPVGFSADTSSEQDTVVAALLRDNTVQPTGVAGVVTIAGAAILAALAQPVAEPPHLQVTAIGVGASARDDSGAGLLHLMIGEAMPVGALPDAVD